MKKWINIAILGVVIALGFLLLLSGDRESGIIYLIVVKVVGLIVLFVAFKLFKELPGLQYFRSWLNNDANNVK